MGTIIRTVKSTLSQTRSTTRSFIVESMYGKKGSKYLLTVCTLLVTVCTLSVRNNISLLVPVCPNCPLVNGAHPLVNSHLMVSVCEWHVSVCQRACS